jgi:hypothetical protein
MVFYSQTFIDLLWNKARRGQDTSRFRPPKMCVYCHPTDPIFHPDPKLFYWKIKKKFPKICLPQEPNLLLFNE